MARKNDKSLRDEFETTLISQSRSVERTESGSYKDNDTEVLYVAFRRAYKDALKHHGRLPVDSKLQPKRVIGRQTDDGFYLFSRKPFVHGSLISCDTELARLAEANPGVKFCMFCLEKTELHSLTEESEKENE
jgi:hypothetical protein